MKKKRIVSLLLAVVMALGAALPGLSPAAQAAAPEATLTVDLSKNANTGEIIHGAAGFLYGVSSEDVPTTNTIVPLKSKILVTKGALGTEHPYGDALDVAKTFLESGGEQVQMYNSNYYGVFGVTATPQQYASDLKTYICPAIVDWKEAWEEEHGTPQNPKDSLGKTIDIDEAIVYVPINEGTPAGTDFADSWKLYYDAIKEADPEAKIAGPNSAGYGWQFTSGQSMKSYIQFCADNNCMPDVITWHELETDKLQSMSQHMDDFHRIWETIDWSNFNGPKDSDGIPEIPQVCINEYAEIGYCGVPGRLVNWIARLEDEKITGCLPFWHQANNLNDLAASANEGNGAWWLYQWYGNMSGTTQPVTTSSSYDQLYGVSTMDEAKKLSTTLLGGWTGDITVQLDNVTETSTFSGAACVDVTVEEAMYSGFHSPVTETPTILSGTYPVNDDGSVTITIPDALFESAYKVTVSQSTATSAENPALVGSAGDVYEAELAQMSGGASATAANSYPPYYMSGTGNRAADMPSGASMTYTIDVPVDGRYRLDFVYGNGQGSVRNDMDRHNTVNAVQTIALDGGEAERVIMESTLFQTMTGTKTLYKDLKAGTHTITVTTSNEVHIDGGMLLHDFLRVRYDSAYGEDAGFNRVYEAELADFNNLLNGSGSTVTTETDKTGYSGAGYVTGLSDRSVKNGGGIRYTVVVDNSGLYNLTLRYQTSEAGFANIYVGNTATTLDRLNKTVDLATGADWQTVTATIYLQKGINIVDVDATVNAAVDYLRVRELDNQTHSTTIEAENAIPEELKDEISVANSEGASGGKYVVGMPGSYTEDGREYLEFTYDAPSAGKYQMQVFHSNEDLAGSHTYNIKAVDKYATVEVNGESDSPEFELASSNENTTVYYFVDCGDHDPSTVSEGDSLGTNNSVTDQIYGKDAKTEFQWGVMMETEGEEDMGYQGGSYVQSEDDDAVYTTYQRALSNSKNDLLDGKSKTETFRYAHNQQESGIDPRYISYAFELEPGQYDVTVAMSNTWNNANNPTVTLSVGDKTLAEQQYNVNAQNTHTMTIDLSDQTEKVVLSVKATSSDPTIQMNYIRIESHQEDKPETVTLPGGVEVNAGALPDDVYVGALAPNDNTLIDYRNMKNSTDRYFFINTFSDDTFREKTITLDLQKGDNTIRIYNDNSWQVTFGGTQSTPGLQELPNYTPNFDKFIITPMALDSAESQEAQYNVSISSTEGGLVQADKTVVKEKGTYTLTITTEGQTPTVLVNGVKQTATKDEKGAYIVTVSNVTADQQVEVYFLMTSDSVQSLVNTLSALKADDYTAASYANLQSAIAAAKDVLAQENPSAIDLQEVFLQLQSARDSLCAAIDGLTYFVDCGDHDPATLSGLSDDFGSNNSVTDQIYGKDAKTGFQWGVVMEDKDEKQLNYTGGSQATSESDKAVYTTFQRALSNSQSDLLDGKDKLATFRYAHNQQESGIDPRYVSYAFELEPGQYDVTVAMSNTWNNANNPTVTLSVGDKKLAEQQYDVNAQNTHTMSIDLSEESDNVMLSVKATSSDPTIQMAYITIVRTDEATEPGDGGSTGGGSTGGGSTGGGTHIDDDDVPLGEPSFVDVADTDWFSEAVAYVVDQGLMSGVSKTEFAPDSPMTRAMIVTVLARMEGVDTDGGSTWYEIGRQWAMENGISDGTNMMGQLTREQLAAMLYRYAGSPAVSGEITGFADVDTISDWAQDAMLWAVENGILSGSGDRLNPRGSATRAQVAAMLMRFDAVQ